MNLPKRLIEHPLIWTIGVAALLIIAIRTSSYNGLPHGIGIPAFLIAAGWTLWLARD